MAVNIRRALPCLIAMLIAVLANNAQAGERWDALWRNADQRGEQLLHDGKAADAAHTYRDPRRKAYAELAAGDYKAAAQGYAAFDDSESQYNRGNALAHSGDLDGALKAYDAALAKDPHNADAKKNRDLVEKALKQQNPPQSQQQNRQQDSQNKKDQPQDQKQASAADQKQNDQTSSTQKNAADPAQDDASQDQAQNPTQNKEQNAKPAAASPPQQSAKQNQPADDKTQARQDAQDAAAQQQSGAEQPRQAAAKSEAPKSEQQLAEEQWLRQIPDDPGGLLRRKFMIEHLMRQQREQQK